MNEESKPSHVRAWLLAPLLAAAYPVLSVYAQNVDEAQEIDLLQCWISVSLMALLFAYLCRYFFGSRLRASIGSALFTIWFFAFSAFLYASRAVLSNFHVPELWILIITSVAWVLVVLALVGWLKWYPFKENTLIQASSSVTWLCGVLVGLACFQAFLGYRTLQAAAAGHESTDSTASENEVPEDLPTKIRERRKDPKRLERDVYYLVFDRYANGPVLKKYFDFDNSKFYAELEKRGFRVYRDARTSYPMTLLSMSSTLNMRYHTGRLGTFADYAAALAEHVVGKWFIEVGYTYYHIGCSFGPLQRNHLAQENISAAIMSSEFSHALLRMTPVGRVLGNSLKHREILGQLAAVVEVAKDDRPTFAYAHVNSPHPPYIFKRNGTRRNLYERFPVGSKIPYTEQLVATNSMILETIDEILANSPETPIIVLQSDEGPYLGPKDKGIARIDKIAKRTSMLSAMLIPDKEIADKLPSELAPVNTFRFLFHEYWEVPIDLLPTRIFWWDVSPFRHSAAEMDVTEEIKKYDIQLVESLKTNPAKKVESASSETAGRSN